MKPVCVRQRRFKEKIKATKGVLINGLDWGAGCCLTDRLPRSTLILSECVRACSVLTLCYCTEKCNVNWEMKAL
jgi:hypothetical protein